MKEFEKHIKEKFQGFEVEPPPDMWHRIEQHLDHKPAGKRFIWYKVAAAVALLVVTMYSSIVYLPGVFDNNQVLTETSLPADSIDNAFQDAPKSILQQVQPSATLAPSGRNHVESSLHAAHQVTVEPETGVTAGIADNAISQVVSVPSENSIPDMLPSVEAFTLIPASQPVLAEGRPAIDFVPNNEIQSLDLLLYDDDVIALAPDGNNRSKFAISAFVSPQTSFRYQSRSAKLAYEPVESHLRSIGYGINLHYRISPAIELQTGLSFTRLGQRIHDIAVFSGESGDPLFTFRGQPTSRHPQSMVSSMGAVLFTDQSYYYADISSSRVITLKGSFDEGNVGVLRKTGLGLVQHFDFLQIPLMARIQLFENRFFFLSAKAGLSAKIFRSGRVRLDGGLNREVVGNIVVVSNYNLAGSFGVILGVPVADRVNLLIEPTFSMFINSLGENANISGNTHPYSNSVFVGLSYDL